mmetsp:Transcript_20705/g.45071  ORF Transcript_20705/g.45071 Transcript_20705/m.45071 type:complete len:263 (-) Transcript_20705:179-967(-)
MVQYRPPIVLFGDSITQFAYGESPFGTPVEIGWAALLSSAYQRRADVLNRGFTGYNSRHALELVPKIFGTNSSNSNSGSRPLFCTVFFGANDATLPSATSDSGRQHIPINEYADNMRKIVEGIREAIGKPTHNDNDTNCTVPIILITPPPVDAEQWKKDLGKFDHCDRSNSAAREYGEALKNVASSLDHCPVLDTWELLGGDDFDTYQSYFCDGLHLNNTGNQLVYEGIASIIQSKYPHLAPAEENDTVGIKDEEPAWEELC